MRNRRDNLCLNISNRERPMHDIKKYEKKMERTDGSTIENLATRDVILNDEAEKSSYMYTIK